MPEKLTRFIIHIKNKAISLIKVVNDLKKTILLLMIIFIFCSKLTYAESYFGFNVNNTFSINKINMPSVEAGASNEYNQRVGMANPAAVYCQNLGYTYNVTDSVDGQDGVCIFPDGSQCEQWQFLQGLCGQKYSYCALNGYNITTKYDGNDSISPIYSVCINETNESDIDSVTNMFNLVDKSVRSEIVEQPNLNVVVENALAEKTSAESVPTLPSQFDWRDATYEGVHGNWVTPIKNQASCGSCWAFSAVGVAESEYKFYKKDPAINPDFSEEYLVSDCLKNNNCCGGFQSSANAYMRDYGILDNNCMPYRSATCSLNTDYSCNSNTCRFSQKQPVDGDGIPYICANSQCTDRCSDWQNRTKRVDYIDLIKDKSTTEIKEDLIKYGPLSTTMLADPLSCRWDHLTWVYSCGNYNDRRNHAVIIVGYDDNYDAWIVKNSWGTGFPTQPNRQMPPGYEGPNTQGYFYVAYRDCGIEKELYFSSGFNGLTTWSGMDVRNDTVHDGSNADVETFSSQQAPANSFAVSCVSKSATDERQDWYGDDDIVGITMDQYIPPITPCSCYGPCPPGTSPQCNPVNGSCCIIPSPNECKVTADDVESGFEQKRETGVVAIPKSYNSNKPQITWSNWDIRNSSVHDGSESKTETFFNNNSCPSGYFPISCLSQSANNENQDWYGEDDIVNIFITSESSPKCSVTAYDNVGDGEHKRMVGTVCYPQQPTIVWGNWDTRDDNTHDGADSRVETFFGPDCPSGYFPISCLSQSANNENQDWYGEDAIQNIVVSGNSCVVTARDESGNGEQKRRVGTVCLPQCKSMGEINGDGIINMKDIATIVQYFNKPISTCPNCDVSGTTPGVPDGKIDMKDIAFVNANFNKRCS